MPMMHAAEWYSELITDLEADGSRLRKAQMMRIGWLSCAHKTWLRGDEFR